MSFEPAKRRSCRRLLLPVSLTLLLLLSALQLGLYLYGYDFSAELYLPGALPTVTAILWIAAAVGAGLLALTLPRKAVCRELKLPSTLITDFASLLVAASLVSAVALPLLNAQNNDPLGVLLSTANPSDSTARNMLRISLVLAAFAAVYFLLRFIYRKTHPLGVTAMLLWAGFSALRIYFDMRYLLMSPRRVLHLVALVFVLLFFVGELRLARGIATPRFYALTAVPAMVIAGADALTNLILAAMGWVTLGAEISTYFVLLAVAIYCFAGLQAMVAPPMPQAKAQKEATFPVTPSEESTEEATSPEAESPAEASPDSPDTSSPDSLDSPDETEDSPQ